MKAANRIKLALAFVLLAPLSAALAQGVAAANEDISVYEDEGTIVVTTPDGVRRLVGAKDLIDRQVYDIKLEPDPFVAAKRDKAADTKAQSERETAKNGADEPPSKDAPTLADKARVSRLLFEANTHFYKGEFHLAWGLVDEAEAIDPKSYQVLTMKGSLLFQAGAKDLAVQYWQESLAVNPDQKEVERQIALVSKKAT